MFPTNSNSQSALSKIPEALSKGTSGVILLPMNPTQDALAAACSLYLGLSRMGKNVTIACANPVQSDFIGSDKIQNNLSTGGENLVISFPYQDGALDKVDYGVQGSFFNIIISPRPGQARLEPSKVKYSYTGGSLDFIFTVDAPNLNSLGQLFIENQNEINGKNIINIDRHLVNDLYGSVNLVVKTASSTSELVFRVLQTLQIEIDKEIATNLYAGLTVATNNFTSYSVNADTFEVASTLLKAGAIKKAPMRVGAPNMPAMPGMPPLGIPQQGVRPMNMNPHGIPAPRKLNNGLPVNRPFSFPTQQQQRPQAPLDETMKPIEDVEQEGGSAEAPAAAPQDWLKPKIFRGGGLV